MNITKLAALAVAAIVVTGCATNTPRTAQFDPNNKGIIFEDGKPYLIPYGTALIPKEAGPIDNEDLAMLKSNKIQHSCKLGDRGWVEANYYNTVEKSMISKGKNALSEEESQAAAVAGFRSQRIGCTAPLSATEYDYYKNVQIQNAQQVRHNQNLQMQQQQMNQAQWNNVNNSYQPRNCITTGFGYTTCF